MAASKYADAEGVRALAEAGQRLFGENRVQDALAKINVLTEPAALAGLEWHLIGHLQSNKARAAADLFDVIESVDSLPLAEALSSRANEAGRVLPVFLQVNVDNDPAKHGFYTAHAPVVYAAIAALSGLRVEGLMTIGALPGGSADARPTFVALRRVRDDLDRLGIGPPLRQLSMGMSADYEVAIEEGATIVRVGKAMFSGESR